MEKPNRRKRSTAWLVITFILIISAAIVLGFEITHGVSLFTVPLWTSGVMALANTTVALWEGR